MVCLILNHTQLGLSILSIWKKRHIHNIQFYTAKELSNLEEERTPLFFAPGMLESILELQGV